MSGIISRIISGPIDLTAAIITRSNSFGYVNLDESRNLARAMRVGVKSWGQSGPQCWNIKKIVLIIKQSNLLTYTYLFSY